MPVVTDDHRSIDFTVSAGVSETATGQSLERAITRADEVLYYARRNGRDQVVRGAERIVSG